MSEERWITMNSTHVKVDGAGSPVEGPQNVTTPKSSKSLEVRREAVGDAINSLANGASEATVPSLREDIEQYGGTNDITFVVGDQNSGLMHIAEKHGAHVVPGVLEAVVDGDVAKFVPTKDTLHLQKDGYEAILSLSEHGQKKTWLLTGYDIVEGKDKKASDAGGKVSTRHAATQTGPILSRPSLGADASFIQRIATIMKKANISPVIVFDSATARHKDENGFLHVNTSHISKEAINPYYGREIPGWEALALDPEHVYYGYRAGEELAKAAPTFNGLPLLMGHHPESAANPQKEARIGSLGTDAVFAAPYLDNALILTDAAAIAALENGGIRELSAAYMYEPDFSSGTWNSQPYDFVMRNIRGNHVALVPEGRAGADVVVADAQINPQPKGLFMTLKERMARIKTRVIMALDADPAIEKTEVDLAKALLEVNEIEAEKEGLPKAAVGLDEDKDAKIQSILAMCPTLSPEAAKKLADALKELAYSPDSRQADSAVSAAKDSDPTPDPGIKKALDACGLDAESPELQKAFAEGVKYGEGKEKSEPKKLDKEHEAEGMKKAMDAALSKLTMDAVSVEQRSVQRLRDLSAAARAVRPLVGDLADPLTFDSAEDIYGKALDLAGINKSVYPRTSWRGMCDVLLQNRQPAAVALALDAKPEGAFAGLSNIRIME